MKSHFALIGDKGKYHKATIEFHNPNESIHEELSVVAHRLSHQLALRKKYYSVFYSENKCVDEPVFSGGVFTFGDTEEIDRKTFQRDLVQLVRFGESGPANTFCHTRLQIRSQLFDLYKTLCWRLEFADLKENSPDFHSVPKVDNHIHVAAAMPSSFLLRFLKKKVQTEPDTIVAQTETGFLTLADFFARNGLVIDSLNFNKLFNQAPKETYRRFDNFIRKYDVFGFAEGRKLFLKYDNFVGGRFLAEMLGQLIQTAAVNNVFLEYHISLYGKSVDELETLARFIIGHGLVGPNVRWIIQLPRVFELDKNRRSFAEFMQNVFQRFFDATLRPEQYETVAAFLREVVAFDSVDDESAQDDLVLDATVSPQGVFPNAFATEIENGYCGKIPYSFYLYYMWANLATLNRLRKSKGLNVFALRPHCGEAGPLHHLSSAYLLADSVCHGIRLRDSPVLAYIFYLSSIGCSISPTSNNYLFKRLKRNPFFDFFRAGLNVTLSTDDPLMFHMTENPLLEEYAAMRQYFSFSDCDMLEIARNSVLQSGFPTATKNELLGMNWQLPTPADNNSKTNGVSNRRAWFRADALLEELIFVKTAAAKHKRCVDCGVVCNDVLVLVNSWTEFTQSRHYDTEQERTLQHPFLKKYAKLDHVCFKERLDEELFLVEFAGNLYSVSRYVVVRKINFVYSKYGK